MHLAILVYLCFPIAITPVHSSFPLWVSRGFDLFMYMKDNNNNNGMFFCFCFNAMRKWLGRVELSSPVFQTYLTIYFEIKHIALPHKMNYLNHNVLIIRSAVVGKWKTLEMWWWYRVKLKLKWKTLKIENMWRWYRVIVWAWWETAWSTKLETSKQAGGERNSYNEGLVQPVILEFLTNSDWNQ